MFFSDSQTYFIVPLPGPAIRIKKSGFSYKNFGIVGTDRNLLVKIPINYLINNYKKVFLYFLGKIENSTILN